VSAIIQTTIPEQGLLTKYAQSKNAYTDCYSTEIKCQVSQAEFVRSFYCTPLFKLERFILQWLVSCPSTDVEAKQLSEQGIDKFAAWTVEEQSTDQLLMCDIHGRTRSWLMVMPFTNNGETWTRLYFGSAVVAKTNSNDNNNEKATFGLSFNLLLGFHKLYSKLLLKSAQSKLNKLLIKVFS